MKTAAGQTALGAGGKCHAAACTEAAGASGAGQGWGSASCSCSRASTNSGQKPVGLNPTGAAFPRVHEGPAWCSPSARGQACVPCGHGQPGWAGHRGARARHLLSARAGFGQKGVCRAGRLPARPQEGASMLCSGLQSGYRGKSDSTLSTTPRNVPATKLQCSAPPAQQTQGLADQRLLE